MQLDLAYERSVNTALLARLGSEVAPSTPAEIDFESLQAISRGTRTMSQMKVRAAAIVAEKRRKALKEKSNADTR